MPSKRVSVKGKGAELFFGESPASMPADLDDNATTTEESNVPPTPPLPSQATTSPPDASASTTSGRRSTPKAPDRAPLNSAPTPAGPYHSPRT